MNPKTSSAASRARRALFAAGLFLLVCAADRSAKGVAALSDGGADGLFQISGGESRGPDGRWTLDFDRTDGRLQLSMTRGGRGHWSESSSSYRLEDFRDLKRPASGEMPARFALVRDAGTFDFEGHLDATGGSGRFHFTENPEFARAWQSGNHEALSSEQMFSMALHDVSRAFISELRALGYENLSADRLITFRIHGVSPEFIRELAALNYTHLTAERLVTFRIHGVTPEGIRDLASLGYDRIPPDELVSMRIHGATPEYVRELARLGYSKIPAEDLVSMRIHGVTPEYVREFQDLGYRQIPAEDLVTMRIHGVAADFVRDLQSLGYRGVPVDDLVSMRIHGVTIDFVRRVQARDGRASIDEIVSRRIHGRN